LTGIRLRHLRNEGKSLREISDAMGLFSHPGAFELSLMSKAAPAGWYRRNEISNPFA
jgi:hypothetical protein